MSLIIGCINAVAVLETIYYQSCIVNYNKIDVGTYISKIICQLLLIYFRVHLAKISDKIDKSSLNYSNNNNN